ncbi:MAG: enoyl-CoA hydratase/isomerase family protein, partial [Alphaproteobacteria bacterium]
TYTLPRLIGRQNASMMFLSGDRYDGAEALEMGLVDDLVDLSRLTGRAQSMAATIAENAPLAIRSTRKTLRADLAAGVRAATDHEFSEQQWLMKTDDFKEGVRAVSERRPGEFRGK